MTRRYRPFAIVMAAALLAASAVAADARKSDLDDGPQWPNIDAEDGPRWPNVKVEEPATFPTTPLKPYPAPSQAAPIALPDVPPDAMASGARGSTFVPEPQPSPFNFEVGTRYWFSGGSIRFGFTNLDPTYGSPTSTLDWRAMTAHSGEVFARLDHKPSGVFVKGVEIGRAHV